MARARNIKPGFFKNERLVELPFSTRLLFAGLWTLADREGRLEDRPKRVKMEIFPADNVDVDKALQELHDAGFVLRYQNEAGRFVQILAFKTHQTPHYSEKPSLIKPPVFQENCADDCSKTPRVFQESTKRLPVAQPPDSLIPDSPNPESLEKTMSGSPPDAPPLEGSKPNGKGNGAFRGEAEVVLDYLNRATGRDFRFRNPAGEVTPNGEVIIARLKEGYTGEQLREVILLKSERWKGDEKMDEYLRPSTLFGKQKFAQYVAELDRPSVTHPGARW